MNRSITNVIFGGITAPVQSDYKIEGQVTKTTVDETLDALTNAENVILVCHYSSPSATVLICSWGCILCPGRWLWYGSCKGAVCHIRHNKDVALEGYQRALCDPSSCRSHARSMQRPPRGSFGTLRQYVARFSFTAGVCSFIVFPAS